ncbi:geranylgeranyl transferase type-1 subunit beta isoform X2 [Prunus avium]|uniref:Geranylgeranyl transferase type-1 subunit beta isoform X2 n=1 Tax=Prunus avium TaxID=42229 RepID=A0A6P5SI16_PRUAV|nr:geranylgeranyl transferase type-1 subunit beta isoform X2 [Prunus avium]
MDSELFERDRHVTFLQMMYQLLPSPYQSQEINRLTLAYFVISGLDLLNALDGLVDKDAVATWVLSLQAHPRSTAELNNGQFYGFHGSRAAQFPPEDNDNEALSPSVSNLASTYCALTLLKIVGCNLSSIDSESILTSMRNLQQPDGSFMPIHTGAETDLRFIYCAGTTVKAYIGHLSYVGKLEWHGQGESQGVHIKVPGGATYCGVASLCLMGFIEDEILSKNAPSSIIDVPLLLDWCVQRQAADGGFQGRPNKPSDTCYAFWIASVLKILGGHKFIDKKALHGFLQTCQSKYGGFSKFPGQLPDLYHSYYGLTAFSLLEEPGLNPLCVELGMTAIATMGI